MQAIRTFIITASMATAAQAQWTAHILHPPGATSSAITDISAGTQVGWAEFGGVRHACLWSGSSATFLDLHTASAGESTATSCTDAGAGQQAGWAVIGGVQQAAVWGGSPQSFVSLHPPGSTSSRIESTDGSAQVGAAAFGGDLHAYVWASAPLGTDLHPPALPGGSLLRSRAIINGSPYYCGHTQNAGITRAALWHPGPTTFTDIHPPSAVRSTAAGPPGQPAGTAWFGPGDGIPSAGRWLSSTHHFTSLHPLSAAESSIADEGYPYQVGYIGAPRRATLWASNTTDLVDLHAALPGAGGGFISSEAHAIFETPTAPTLMQVGGFATNAAGQTIAILWTAPGPLCYANCDNSPIAPILNIADFTCFLQRFAAGCS